LKTYNSLGQNRIFVESATLVGQTGWRKIISSPINDIDFEGIDLVPNGNSKIYVIAKGAIDITQAEDWLVYEFNNLGDLTSKFIMDRTSQSDVNSKILATPNGLYVSGQTKDGTNPKSSLVKIRTATTDTIPNVDGEESSKYDGYIRNYGQLKNYGTINDAAVGVNYFSTNPYYIDALMKDRIAFVQNQLVDSNQRLFDVNRFDLTFVNGNMEKQIEQNPNGLKRNYYQGNKTKSIVEVDEFESVYIPDLYSNIDLRLTHNKVGIKMIFAKNFKGKLEDIEINMNGSVSFVIDDNKLKIATLLGEIDFEQPSAYQYSNSGMLIELPAFYFLNSYGNIAIDVPNYNPSNMLYIVMKDGNDPIPTPKLLGDNMMWSTYFGEDGGLTISRDVTVDNSNNSYYVGQTECASFISTIGFFPLNPKAAQADAFIIKFDSDIIPQWYTYYGGSVGNNSVIMQPTDIATAVVASSDLNRLYVVGMSKSADLLQPNAPSSTGYTGDQTNSSAIGNSGEIFFDIFVARFNLSTGLLEWNTFYGEEYNEIASDITIDRNYNVYIVGERDNTTPLLPLDGASNYNVGSGLLMKFNINDALTWVNTYLGERITAVCADVWPNIYIAGSTNQSGMTILNAPIEYQTLSYQGGNHDGFLAAFNMNGVLTHSFYYGGSCGDFITGLGVDFQKNIYAIGKTAYPDLGVGGCTGSLNLPIKGNGLPPATPSDNDINHFIFKTNSFFNSSNVPQQVVIEHAGYFGGGGKEFELNSDFGIPYSEAVISVNPNNGVFAISGATNSDDLYNSNIPMPQVQPLNYFFQPNKDSYSYFNLDAYIAVFNSDFELKYSTYFGDGKWNDGASAIAFSKNDNRLYYAGNTQTFNQNTAYTPDEYLYIEEYDNTVSTDFFQEFSINGLSTWFAFFDLNGLDIPGDPINAGVEDVISYQLSIYPNPSNDMIYISSQLLLEELEVYDLQGKVLFNATPDSHYTSFDVSKLSTGTYIVRSKSDHHIIISKFIKL
jgi:hypothetical protein